MTTGASSASQAPVLIHVGEQQFVTRLRSSGDRLEVGTSTGQVVELAPWSLDRHLNALDRHVDAGQGAIRFDERGFAREVLAYSKVPDTLAGELESIALWWAIGGEAGNASVTREGFFEAHGVRARLRKWTFAERERALSESMISRGNGAREFKLARYLRAMVEASVVALEPVSLDELHGAAATTLLNAVTDLNDEREGDADRLVREGSDAGKALAATTLRLCRALGWTPSQVWATSAAEIDRLVALLDAVEAPEVKAPHVAPRTTRQRPSLADYPDAVVIQVEDD